MTRESIVDYAKVMRRRYRAAQSKSEKGVLLSEFCEVTGYHRKSAIRLLRRAPAGEGERHPGRPPSYLHDFLKALKIAWEASGRICSKRLAPFMPELVASLERHGELSVTTLVRGQLLRASPSTIDRLLKPFRRRPRGHPYTSTRSLATLQKKVPMHTFAELRGLPVGHLECDLVAHCGMSTAGFYLTTLVGVDTASGWAECVEVWGKGQSRVGSGVERLRRQLPFALLGVHSDNGSEFLNQGLYDYCRRHKLHFTRSRPYKKNDQPRVEQKNGALVRHLVGYGRYTSRAAYTQLGRVYTLVRLQANFFQPICKLVGRTRKGAKVLKQYDRAQTPYQRLLAAKVLDEPTQCSLQNLFLSLNPLKLCLQIERELEVLWRLETPDPASELAVRILEERNAQAEAKTPALQQAIIPVPDSSTW